MRTLDECRRLPTLADTIWAERSLVEHLLYKLVSAKLLLAADQRRFVSRALSEVEDIVARLWEAENQRTEALERVAADWSVSPRDLTLNELASQTPEPWSSMFSEHHDAFVKLTSEIEETATENRRLASMALNSIQESIGNLTGAETQTYTAAGRTMGNAPGATQVDQSL